MTRGDLRTKLQNHFNNSIYYTEADLNNSIQDGVDEVCAFTGCVYKSAALPFQQNVTYYDMLSLLPDYIGAIAIYNDVTHKWMYPTSRRKLEQQRVDWDSISGTPYCFCPISHRYLAIWMKPAVANYGRMLVFYRAAAPTLVEQTQIPIPENGTDALESYSITDLWEQSQEWNKAATEFKTYISNLEALRVLMRNGRNSDRLMGLKG